MNRVFKLFLTGAISAAVMGFVAVAARAAEAVRIGGKEYLRLPEWAKANDFEVRWVKKDETLQLTSRRAKLSLTVDSREAEINGVAVRLLFPVVYREGRVSIAQLDVQTTFRPILAPPK